MGSSNFKWLAFICILSFSVLAFSENEAPDLSNDACLTCHSDDSLTGTNAAGKEISVFVDGAKFKSSVHGSNECISCHSDITEIPHNEQLKKVDCSGCHSDEGAIYAASTHGIAYAKKIPEAPDCTVCHGEHDILSRTNPASKTHPLNQIRICTSCHMNPKIAGKYNLPSVDAIETYRESIHGRGLLKSGLMISATCVSCHTAHNVRPKTDPKSSIYWANIPKLCGSCHLGILEDFAQSQHGQLWQRRSAMGPGCITCHGSHRIQDPVTIEFQLNIPNICGACHKMEKPTYRDNFHGQVSELGFVQAASCASCHTAHKNLSKKDPRSTVHPSHLKETCGWCHGKVDDAYVTYDPHMDPRQANGNPIIHYIWLFFVAMIWLVFGFFGIHYLLWLIRCVVGFKRGELKPEKPGEGPYIRRFARPHVWVHVAVAASFTVLSITGFTIYFHDTRWASVTASLLGGIGFMRYLHRTSAIITFGYAFFHIGYLAYCYFVKKERRFLWGPGTMTPNLKDLSDFYHNVRWFLFLGPMPKLDRWAYWEKLEYLVEFWGVPVIGLSGLCLWFPKFFTHFLPGWTLNAAQVIHTYEAFLAAGYVFLFHFFVANFRPETFPFDPVIFTGKMTLERFRHERPLEYQRLAESGELEKLLEDPPSTEHLRNARIFGFVVMIAGLLLMVGILKSVFLG
ncbi:MAG TPA: cytochrome c3 family protein [Acidobacteriota bacterium]|nr:cytochrome c3 family protein [Acidobacteriota bacterium]